MLKQLLKSPAIVLGAVLLWKLLLLAFAQLPPPSNDSFFYDGAAANWVQHGRFCNPPLELAMPISGREVFSAYPPLHPLLAYVWMKAWGVSAVAMMWLHWLLLCFTAALVFYAAKQLRVPDWTISLGSLFFLCITFQDRPDSLAHVLGLSSVCATLIWLMARGTQRTVMPWVAACALIGAACTGLQIAALYYAVVWLLFVLSAWTGEKALPVGAMVLSVLAPVAMIACLYIFEPRLVAGFIEHARQTPSITGWRTPRMDELVKLARTLPGTLAFGCIWIMTRPVQIRHVGAGERAGRKFVLLIRGGRTGVALGALLIPSLLLAFASMTFFTPNGVSFAAHLQPLIVSVALSLAAANAWRKQKLALVAAALCCFGSVRQAGLSTWGVACAKDCGYAAAMIVVEQRLSTTAASTPVVGSAAYLYEMSRHEVRAIHCDWLAPAGKEQERIDLEGLRKLRPPLMLLTQFDYYRRYQSLLERVKADEPSLVMKVTDCARLRTPDSMPSIRRVLQHISWAPVVVEIQWP